MARGLKTRPPICKGRLQQTLKRAVAIEVAKVQKERNPAGKKWLRRHMERQHGRCAYCGIPMFLPPLRRKQKEPEDRRATLDHVRPRVRGGADSEANTVAACLACNTEKDAMTAQAFRMSAFLKARKAFAATIPERKPVRQGFTVVLRRPRRPPQPAQSLTRP